MDLTVAGRRSALALTPRARRMLRFAGPAVVLFVAAVTRLAGLGHPPELVYDEATYVRDAWTTWRIGTEATWPDGSSWDFARGASDLYDADAPRFAAHPPLGKWLIGLGMVLAGPASSFGWRIVVAIAGILLVGLTMLVAHRLTRSLLIATIAGGLLAITGDAIVLSRIAILDGLLAFLVLLGVWFVLIDGDRQRGRPAALWRPWLLAAGLAFGAATAVKWSGAWFLAAFGIYAVVVGALALRRAGERRWALRGLLGQGAVSFLTMVPAALLVYAASWAGWFTARTAYDRTPGANVLADWLRYQAEMLAFGVSDDIPHLYQADAITWPLLLRPTAFWFIPTYRGEQGCASEICGSEIIPLPNPLVWYASIAAVIYLLVRLVLRRERPVAAVLLGVAAGWVPWLFFTGRTVFQYYTIVCEPFLVIALAMALGDVLARGAASRRRRTVGRWLVGGFLVLVCAASVYFWPLWEGQQIDFGVLQGHWWLPGWK